MQLQIRRYSLVGGGQLLPAGSDYFLVFNLQLDHGIIDLDPSPSPLNKGVSSSLTIPALKSYCQSFHELSLD